VELLGLRKDSWQGDQRISELMRHFGVKSRFTKEGVTLTKVRPGSARKVFEIDFTDTPDLAQTIAVVSAAKGMPVKMTGLKTLRIKETDRINALQQELTKFGVNMKVEGDDCLIEGKSSPTKSSIDTYEDHRMAMAFAPMVLLQPTLMINDHEVVEKSYPEFWQHLEQAGIRSNVW
jgi:3-phosphoshikimate 1-carboxyvinyltransferase